jgi:hypothetical protein
MPSHGKARDLTAAALSNHEPFRRSGFAMTATDKPNEVSWGYLPQEQITEFREARDAGRITYVVLSYNTPIAWVLSDGSKVVPAVKYSVTTTNHQGMCRQYL